MKLLLENWREYINENRGLDTTWDDVHIDDVFRLIGKSCKEGRECKSMPASVLSGKIKNKEVLNTVLNNLDPEKLVDANYEFPLIVVVDKGEYQYIFDGNHRFAAALADEELGKDAIVQVKELYTEEYNELFGDLK